MKKIILGLIVLVFSYVAIGQITDKRDGKTYKTVKIGTQEWMAENLHTFYFRNGDAIPIIKNLEDWVKAGENKHPACCYYENNGENGAKYGLLYNWYAVNDPRGLAPEGCHVPSDAEWTTLTDYLTDKEDKMKCTQCLNWSPEKKAGTECDRCNDKGEIEEKIIPAGPKMKSTSGWKEDWNGTNESGFNGLPVGGRESSGSYGLSLSLGSWWSSSQSDSNNAWARYLYYAFSFVSRHYYYKAGGFSVRCLKD